jgi:hypothetical protein
MRVMGGNANVMMAEFIDWFEGLWQGQTLGETIAVLTIVATLLFRFIAARLTPAPAGMPSRPKISPAPGEP